jgi:class 3 adenylate cyclase/tetratricopeptide (TPR) repeat protein
MTSALASCPVCGAANTETARFCSTCGTELGSRRIEEVRKVVTILFADVTGSTALGEQLDPEAMRAIMAQYFAMMKRVIERHGGTVEKFIGDAVMAVFGIPVVHEDDALRAVRAAAEIKTELAAFNAELLADRGVAIRFRTGVNTGEVVAGDPTAAANLVTGDTVNTAARLEQNAPPDEVYLGRLTYQLVRDAVEAEAVEPIAAKGKADPVPAYRLIAVREGAAGHSRRLDAPLVGRVRELGRLKQAFADAAADRNCQLFTLLGSAGVGKSRLVAEFVNGLGEGARVVTGRCLPYGEGITYWPIGEIVRSAAGIDEADTAEGARARIQAALQGDRDAEVLAGRIAAAIGLSSESTPQEELFWAIRRFLEHLARDRSTVVLVEDIHWAEATLLDLLEHIADWSRDAPLLLLCAARPELLDTRPSWGGGKLNATTLLLEPLLAGATQELIAALPGGATLPADVIGRIETAAEGNPLFVEEFLGMLIDKGLVSQTATGGWEAALDVADVTVPASISALLSARLEQLAMPERKVAERASVVGRVFETEAVSELADDALRPDVRSSILALVRKELVRPDRSELTPGEAFKFRHILIRDVAYEALPKSERAQLHERFAGWLERTAGGRLTELEEIVGHHLAQAYRYRAELGESGERVERLAERAAERLAAAGQRSLNHGDAPSAIQLLESAVAIQPTHDDGLRLSLARALADAGRFGEARTIALDVATRSRESENVILEARAVVLNLDLELDTGNSVAATFADLLAEARSVVERAGDPLALSTYWRIFSNAEWNLDRYTASIEAGDRAIRYAEIADDRRALDEARLNRAVALVSGPDRVSAALAGIDALVTAPGVAIMTRAELLEDRGLLKAMSTSWDDARADVAEALRLTNDFGQGRHLPENRRISAWIERLAGDYEEQIVFLDMAIATYQPSASAVSYYGGMLQATRALALAKVRRTAEAREDAERAAGAPGGWVERLRDQAWARIFAEEGRADEAAERARALEAAAPDIPFPFARSEALIESAVVAAMIGDADSAERRGRAAMAVASAKGSLAHQRKAEAVLAGDLARL